jgi:acyl CoA:acetate/3-ketoacid CoA transferase beta subunit
MTEWLFVADLPIEVRRVKLVSVNGGVLWVTDRGVFKVDRKQKRLVLVGAKGGKAHER